MTEPRSTGDDKPEHRADPGDALPPPDEGPPGGRIFSLEGRRAPALYLIGWVLSVGGLVLLFLAPLANSGLGRVMFLALGGIALTLGLSAAAGSQIVDRRDRHPGRYRGPSPLLLFGVILAASTLVSAALVATGILDPNTPYGFLLGLLVVAVGYALAVWLFVVRTDALSWVDVGWPAAAPGRLSRALRAIGVAVLVMLPVTIGISLLGGILALILGVQPPDVLPDINGSADALAVALAVAIVAPVGEELFFRGFALTAWLRDLGQRAAIGRSALLFAVIHIVNIESATFGEGAAQAFLQTVVIFPLGLVLGWLFVRWGILAAIAGHVTYNSLLLAMLALRSVLPEPA